MKHSLKAKVKRKVAKVLVKRRVKYVEVKRSRFVYKDIPLPLGYLSLGALYNVLSALRGPDCSGVEYDYLKRIVTGRIRAIAIPEPERIAGVVTFEPLSVADIGELRKIAASDTVLSSHFIGHLNSAMSATNESPIWGDKDLYAIAADYVYAMELHLSPPEGECYRKKLVEQIDERLRRYIDDNKLPHPWWLPYPEPPKAVEEPGAEEATKPVA